MQTTVCSANGDPSDPSLLSALQTLEGSKADNWDVHQEPHLKNSAVKLFQKKCLEDVLEEPVARFP